MTSPARYSLAARVRRDDEHVRCREGNEEVCESEVREV